MPPIEAEFKKAILEARDAFIDEFLLRVPSYTGASRAQLNSITISSQDFNIVFDVPHFLINENIDATRVGVNLRVPGPYNALPAAKAAAEEILERTYNKLLAQILGELNGRANQD